MPHSADVINSFLFVCPHILGNRRPTNKFIFCLSSSHICHSYDFVKHKIHSLAVRFVSFSLKLTPATVRCSQLAHLVIITARNFAGSFVCHFAVFRADNESTIGSVVVQLHIFVWRTGSIFSLLLFSRAQIDIYGATENDSNNEIVNSYPNPWAVAIACACKNEAKSIRSKMNFIYILVAFIGWRYGFGHRPNVQFATMIYSAGRHSPCKLSNICIIHSASKLLIMIIFWNNYRDVRE